LTTAGKWKDALVGRPDWRKATFEPYKSRKTDRHCRIWALSVTENWKRFWTAEKDNDPTDSASAAPGPLFVANLFAHVSIRAYFFRPYQQVKES
jgi:hypothetical protein